MGISNHALTTDWLSEEQEIPLGTHSIEAYGIDDVSTPTAHAEVWLRLTDPDGNTAPLLVTVARGTYQKAWNGQNLGAGWTYNIKATLGTPDGVVVLT